MSATAAVLRSAGAPFTLEPLDLPAPGAHEILVRIVGAGLCHTDLVVRHLPPEWAPLPAVLGHEGAGVVEAVGTAVTRVAVGDHVVLTYDSCGWCEKCHTGQPSFCAEFSDRNELGLRPGTNGAGRDAGGVELQTRWFGQSSFATHSLATERNVVKVDPDLPLELLGPLGCGIQTGAGAVLNALEVRFDSSLVVFGTGAVGLAAVMAARVAGARTIIAVDLHPNRLDLAQDLGATHCIAGNDPDIAAQIVALTGGGATHALDTTAVPSVIAAALGSLRTRGKLGLVGGGGAPLDLPQEALMAGQQISFIIEGNSVPHVLIPQLIELWKEGRFPFERLVSYYPLARINEAERDFKSGAAIKPILLPGDAAAGPQAD
ncbi:NAD(P)-dependent alcohol dehydrogenase [Sphingopyxis chilensis]|uniref:NAD(P)-dependent alcohol dehydrogenase n=1 Tax=Sphingopyxis chilensis TaxID=180400 RepID=UPI002DDCF439|nr:NAD(P)-dependent alcohol dehydrogenase [Sphingopyxis chilensis]